MAADVAIHVENLSKRYLLRYKLNTNLKQRSSKKLTSGITSTFDYLINSFREPNEDSIFWALKGVSFSVNRGEIVGVIGPNGAGKSTLLKILSRITRPSSGYAELFGRVGSLIEVGTGFHPELTGRENMYLNGTILGMRTREIDERFDEIVDFAGVEKFIDTPVKYYSSGMKVRLGFSVAAHLQPEILLVDEVLAVGDVAFQQKCLGKMEDVAQGGRTVLLVSHNLTTIENLCQRSILIDHGKIVEDGPSSQVIQKYLDIVLPARIDTNLEERLDRRGNGHVRFTNFYLEDVHGQVIEGPRSGQDVVFCFGYKVSKERGTPKKIDIGFGINTLRGQRLFVLYASYSDSTFDSLTGEGVIKCRIPKLPLSAGTYSVRGRILVNGEESDWVRNGIGFIDVFPGDFYSTGRMMDGGQSEMLLFGEWSRD
jgi:lipopolysaccharide transport system ATP-binding protein